MVERKNKHR